MEPFPVSTAPDRLSIASADSPSNSDAATVQRPSSNKENFDPGLFARDRNPRRKATKLFREPPSPRLQRQQRPKSTTRSTPDVAASTSARPKKRKPRQDYHWPSERRRKRSRESDASTKAHTTHPCEAMDHHAVPSVDVSNATATALSTTQPAADHPGTPPVPSEHAESTLDQHPESYGHTPLVQSEQETELPADIDHNSGVEQMVRVEAEAEAKVEVETEVEVEVESQSEATDYQDTEYTSESGPSLISESTVDMKDLTKADFSPISDPPPEKDIVPMPETPPFVADCLIEPEIPPLQGLDPISEHVSTPEPPSCIYDPLRRPIRDTAGFVHFVEQMKSLLREQSTTEPPRVGTRQARRILSLLEAASPPDETDAAFVTGPEATEKLNSRYPGIIVTEGQQLLPLQTVDQFLGEYYNSKSKVWIQDPSVELSQDRPSVRQVTIAQIRKRFSARRAPAAPPSAPSPFPWNLLELATHCDDGLRPVFLNSEDCRLLTKLKIPLSDRHARRRAYTPGYKEVEKWALLAEAGALTEPHQDSHGYATFITVNAGTVGFGWLSNPTPAERGAWCAAPHRFRGGSWRYLVLTPGQTVYFPAGTVHFVFRHPATGDSLAFGGHVLRCSGLGRWVSTMLEEKRFPDVTNEDITTSAPGYLAQVERFVSQAVVSGEEGRMAKWGGREGIEEFLRLKKEFLG